MLGKNILSMSGLSLFRNAVQFGMNIAIASFVVPAAYGLVVFTTPFVVLLAMLTDLGMTSAVTRTPTLSREEAGAAMGVMTVVGAVCAGLLIAAAWPIERWLAMPGLAPVMSAMGGVVVLSIAAATPRALLERSLRYGRIASIEAAAISIAAVVGLAAAWHGAGVWSLILYNLTTQIIRLSCFGWEVRGRLVLNLTARRLRHLLSFGGWVLASNVLNFIARNSDNLLIGAWLGAAAVGVYGLSYQFMLAPVMAITWPTSGILLATLRDQDPHGRRAQDMVESVVSATALIVFPTMLYLTFGLHFPVQALLSSHWQPVPEIVAWLAPAGALQSIASYNGALLMAAGRARAQFILTVTNTLVLVATFLCVLPFGLLTMVKAYTLATVVLSFAYLAMIVSLTGLKANRLARAVALPLLVSGSGVLAVALSVGIHPQSVVAWGEATALYAGVVIIGYALLHGHVRWILGVLTTRSHAGEPLQEDGGAITSGRENGLGLGGADHAHLIVDA